MLTHTGTARIVTERLILRKYALYDAEAVYENYANDAEVTKYLSWRPYKNVGEVRDFLSYRLIGDSRRNNYRWAIEFERRVIGGVSAESVDEKNRSCEIGYCVGRGFWNRGFATEALGAVIRHMFINVGVNRISGKHDAENAASGRVMEKCGMVREGRLRGYYIRHDGTVSDSIAYGILKSDFGAAGATGATGARKP